MSIDLENIIKVTVSGLRGGEEAAVTALITACGLPAEDLTPRKLRHFVIARKGDHPVGTAGLEILGRQSLLRSLAVAEAYRGRGIAEKLVTAAERYALSLGIDTLYLLTVTAERLFVGMGYTRIDRSAAPPEIRATEEFKCLCPEHSVCMKKRLSKPRYR
jgi:amino-acid N-acetyltransferase